MLKRRTIFIIVAVIVVMLSFATMLFALWVHMSANLYIFADIDECTFLASMNQEEGEFTKYADTLSDNHVKELPYTSFFAGKFSGEKISFQIFAYEFDSELSARAYFENATGKNTGKLDQNFSLVSGLLESHIVIFAGNRAYSAYFPTRSLSNVLQIFEDCFSVRIK